MIRVYILSICYFAIFKVAAASGQQNFQQELQYAHEQTSQVISSIQNFNPDQKFNGYTDHPVESSSYYADHQNNDHGLKKQGMYTLQHSEIGQVELDSNQYNPKGSVSLNSDYIKESLLIKSHANAIARGYSDNTINCDHPQNNPNGILCGGDFYCMDGHCSSHNAQTNSNFGKTTAALAAVGSGAVDVNKSQDKNANSIFSGSSMSCADDATGFVSCCKDKGWGKDLNLAHCSQEEKQLGQNRQNNLTIYIGRYCSHRTHVLHACLQHKKVFCSFDSRLAKIVQNQGRFNQLHINFGDVGGHHSYPNCRGISADEFSKINFSMIDFSSIYQDIKDHTNVPSNRNVDTEIESRIQDFYDRGGSHDKYPS